MAQQQHQNGPGQNGKTSSAAVSSAPDKPKEALLVPPDGGWGWVIVFGTVINLMVIPTTVTCFGVMVPFIVREFDANIAAVSWIPGLAVAVLNLLGPWTSAMLGIYSHRRLGIIGSFVCAASIVASSFAPSVMVLFATYGLSLGFGCALSSTMGMLITQEYFAKRRPLANGLMMAGGSLGQMLIPLVMQNLFDGFGLRGGLLVYSGVVLQSLVAACLFQPSRWHWKLAGPPPAAQVEQAGLPLLDHKEPAHHQPRPLARLLSEEHGDPVAGRNRSSSWTGGSSTLNGKHSADVRRVQQADSQSMLRSFSVSSHKDPVAASKTSLAALSYAGSVGSLASLAPVNAKVVDAPVQMTLTEMRQQLKIRNQEDRRPVWLRWMPRCPPPSKILRVELIKNPFFIIMSVAMAMGRLTYQQFNVLVPSYAQSIGVDATSAASLVTILAAADTVARLFVPILADKLSRFISTLNVCLIEFVVCAIGSFALALSNDYVSMVVSCVVYGIGIGGITGLTVVVIVQSLGMDKLTAAFGLNVFISGIVVFPGIIIIGYIQVITQSFPICFYVVGGICLLCCCLWAPLPVILRRQNAATKPT